MKHNNETKNMELKERFLRYVGFDTQSDESSTTFPSTDKQLVLLRHLAEEMKELGLCEVEMDEHGYVMGRQMRVICEALKIDEYHRFHQESFHR